MTTNKKIDLKTIETLLPIENLKLIPLVEGKKNPRVKWTKLQKNYDPQAIEWRDTDNVGLLTGNGICVLDIDKKNDVDGYKTLKKLEDQYGPINTFSISTPSGGKHLYFKISKTTKLPCKAGLKVDGFANSGLDFRAERGYIVVPPSKTSVGKYEVIDPSVPIEDCPDWLIDLVLKKNITAVNDNVPSDDIHIGNRNSSLFLTASELNRRNQDIDEALEYIRQANKKFAKPLSDNEVNTLVKSAYSYDHQERPALTDMGNSDRLVLSYSEDLCYIPEYKTFYFWNEAVWEPDFDGHTMRLAKQVAKDIAHEADELSFSRDEEKIKAIQKHGKSSQSQRRLNAMVDLVKVEIPLSQSELDNNDYLLGVKNGVIDLKKGQLNSPKREDYISKQANVEYDEDATCPLWEQFILDIMCQNEEMTTYLQCLAGYILSGDCSEQGYYFLYGYGANGKTTFLNVLSKILGDYSAQINSENLMMKKHDNGGPNPEIAKLVGKRLVISSEIGEGSRLNESLIKGITGQDTISCRNLYQSPFEYTPKFKLLFAGNHKPHINGTDDGVWRRTNIIKFEASFPKEKQDPRLEVKLLKESSGILNWMISGYLMWQEGGLKTPASIQKENDEYRYEQDIINLWIEECCILEGDSFMTYKKAFESYSIWAEEAKDWNMSKRSFTNKILEKGFSKIRRGPGWGFTGMRFSTSLDHLDIEPSSPSLADLT